MNPIWPLPGNSPSSAGENADAARPLAPGAPSRRESQGGRFLEGDPREPLRLEEPPRRGEKSTTLIAAIRHSIEGMLGTIALCLSRSQADLANLFGGCVSVRVCVCVCKRAIKNKTSV